MPLIDPVYKISRPNNLNLIRYYLAFSVLINHFSYKTGLDYFWPTSSHDRIGAFFVLSGFLVYASYRKAPSLKSYIDRRARRILPAYCFVVIFFAIALVAVSSLPAVDYFFSLHWLKYLVSNLLCLNFLEPSLPGVFTDQGISAVNGSLWTMKVEWLCYLLLPLIIFFYRKTSWHPLLFFGIIYIVSVSTRIWLIDQYETTGKEIYEFLSRQFVSQMAFFCTGIVIYLFLDYILKHRWVILALVLALMVVNYFWFPTGKYLYGPICTGLLVMILGFTGKWGHWMGSNDNISYELYLFHFPIYGLAEHFKLVDAIGGIPTFIVCLLVIGVISYLFHYRIGAYFLKSPERRLSRVPNA